MRRETEERVGGGEGGVAEERGEGVSDFIREQLLYNNKSVSNKEGEEGEGKEKRVRGGRRGGEGEEEGREKRVREGEEGEGSSQSYG